jgi:hypothetical protein
MAVLKQTCLNLRAEYSYKAVPPELSAVTLKRDRGHGFNLSIGSKKTANADRKP